MMMTPDGRRPGSKGARDCSRMTSMNVAVFTATARRDDEADEGVMITITKKKNVTV